MNCDTTIETNENTSITSSSPENSNDIHLNIENNIVIENIQEETNLIDYTEHHFNMKIKQDLEKIRNTYMNNDNVYNSEYNNYYYSNSPVTLSNNGSRSNSNNCSSCDSDSENNIDYDSDNNPDFLLNHGFKKLSYKNVEKIINKYYNLNNDNKFSSEIDILTTFIKGQKNLYIQSKHSTQRKLHCLMVPSLIISAFITIIAPFIECTFWSAGLISGLNAIIMLCVSFINYLKLESSIENYLYNVKQYDKLETTLEMTNNKLLFINNDKEKSLIVLNKIKEVERKINEIKESTNALIPEDVKLSFPIICHINIFSFIKKVENYKKNLIIKFKDVKNEIRYILFKMEINKKIPNNEYENKKIKYENRLNFLYEVKNKLKTEIFDFQSTYSNIDTIFTKEIKNSEISRYNFTNLLCFWRTSKKNYYKGINPVIDKYIQFIVFDE
jgi:hypothetical protein